MHLFPDLGPRHLFLKLCDVCGDPTVAGRGCAERGLAQVLEAANDVCNAPSPSLSRRWFVSPPCLLPASHPAAASRLVELISAAGPPYHGNIRTRFSTGDLPQERSSSPISGYAEYILRLKTYVFRKETNAEAIFGSGWGRRVGSLRASQFLGVFALSVSINGPGEAAAFGSLWCRIAVQPAREPSHGLRVTHFASPRRPGRASTAPMSHALPGKAWPSACCWWRAGTVTSSHRGLGSGTSYPRSLVAASTRWATSIIRASARRRQLG